MKEHFKPGQIVHYLNQEVYFCNYIADTMACIEFLTDGDSNYAIVPVRNVTANPVVFAEEAEKEKLRLSGKIHKELDELNAQVGKLKKEKHDLEVWTKRCEGLSTLLDLVTGKCNRAVLSCNSGHYIVGTGNVKKVNLHITTKEKLWMRTEDKEGYCIGMTNTPEEAKEMLRLHLEKLVMANSTYDSYILQAIDTYNLKSEILDNYVIAARAEANKRRRDYIASRRADLDKEEAELDKEGNN